MSNSNILGPKLKIARKKAGYSQKQLGQLLKISDKAISSYELGRAEPSFDSLRKMCMVLNVPATFFFGDEALTEEMVLKRHLTQLQKQVEQLDTDITQLKRTIIAELHEVRQVLKDNS